MARPAVALVQSLLDENIALLELVAQGRAPRERLACLGKGGAVALVGAQVTRGPKWIHDQQANNTVQLK
eukprot:13536614-Alexandrium_andersonii.AAC.1